MGERNQILDKGPISIISNDCFGGFVYKKLGLKYTTPFMWLWLEDKDYLKLLNNLEYYLKCTLTFTKENAITYPIGLLDDIKIYFNHYSTESEAREKWNRRLEKFNWNNILVKFSSENKQCIYEFDKLKYKNKVSFMTEDFNVEFGHEIYGWKKNTNFNMHSQNLVLEQYRYFDWLNWFFEKLDDYEKEQVKLNLKNRFSTILCKNIVLFGASKSGEDLYKVAINIDLEANIKYFCDNDTKKWGDSIEGINVISPMDLERIYNSEYGIIITSMYEREIREQLMSICKGAHIINKSDFTLALAVKRKGWIN